MHELRQHGPARRHAPFILAALMSVALAGCGGGSMFGNSNASADTSAASSPSIGSRFSQIFGSRSQALGEAPPPPEDNEPTCPPVSVRFGASTLAVGLPGKPASGLDLRYQASILRTARDCTLSGGQIHARVGIQGRIIAGAAGAPPTVDIPMRVALMQEGVTSKVIFTKAVQTPVALATDVSYTDFSMVIEDIAYPVPKGDEGDNYIFYIGFDPAAQKPAPRTRGRKH
ncbi:putative lipoprotein [Afipia carboxidovorans OM5]|nr:putative lipoprotein [Afipia carboxidovorans OM5]